MLIPDVCGDVRANAILSEEQSAIVEPFKPAIAAQWDEFVRQHPEGTFFHLLGWKRALEKAFGYESCYLYAHRDKMITGVMPLFRVKNWVMGDCLMSTPFAVYGGPCAADEGSARALLAAISRCIGKRTEFVELRMRKAPPLPGYHGSSRYVTFTTELLEDEQSNFKRLPRDTRYMIRKAEKYGLRVQHGLEQLREFYKLFAISMRRLGTPVLPRSWFEDLLSEFSDCTSLLLVYAGSRPVSGVLSFRFRDTVLPYYSGALPEANKLAANNYLYWALIKQSTKDGLRYFDFGRSKKGTGSYAFKTQWGMRVDPLDYQYYLVHRDSVPNFSPLNPKLKLATLVWSRLPLGIATRVGPHVVRWFP